MCQAYEAEAKMMRWLEREEAKLMTEQTKKMIEERRKEIKSVVTSSGDCILDWDQLTKHVITSELRARAKGIVYTQECRVLGKDPCKELELITEQLNEIEGTYER